MPDKIYIQLNAHDRWFEGNKPNDNFVEYLRKDALLEWAKETIAELENQNALKEDVCNGAIWELEEIIAKIQSL